MRKEYSIQIKLNQPVRYKNNTHESFGHEEPFEIGRADSYTAANALAEDFVRTFLGSVEPDPEYASVFFAAEEIRAELSILPVYIKD